MLTKCFQRVAADFQKNDSITKNLLIDHLDSHNLKSSCSDDKKIIIKTLLSTSHVNIWIFKPIIAVCEKQDVDESIVHVFWLW